MTQFGGSNGLGNVFSVGTNGSNFQNLLSFTGTGGASPGSSPSGSLTLIGMTLYGMTGLGGGSNEGTLFSIGVNGTASTTCSRLLETAAHIRAGTPRAI